MALKKSELYSSLWRGCDELRGGMDASQYKDYVLVLLFMKYVSDRYAGDSEAPIVVPDGASFTDMVALRGQVNIGEEINKIIFKLAEANDLVGIITVADFNDPEKLGDEKEMMDRLTNLLGIFNNPTLNFGRNTAEGDDLLGDAYEYLMRHFATESGKSKGQFYTPAEVSRIMARVIGMDRVTEPSQTIYDPTCGSGSLLLKAAAQSPVDISIYGQEMDNATRALARMNMILHNNPSADIVQGNTLASPRWTEGEGQLKTFDHVVANPPFSTKSWSNGLKVDEDKFRRFVYGEPPAKNGDYAFLLHILASMKNSGTGAVILPHGVLFRGNAEAGIRKNLIRRGFIKGIIGLPANLFYGTGIPACIIVLDKKEAGSRTGIFMVDASKGYAKDGNKNRLRHQDVHRIVDVFTRQMEVLHFSRMVPITEILNGRNDGNLNIPRYIGSGEREDVQSIAAHLLGGLPNGDIDALEPYWNALPAVRKVLFTATDRPDFSALKVAPADVRVTILEHPQFKAYADAVHATAAAWSTRHTAMLESLDVGNNPKTLMHILGEDILTTYAETPLLDAYDLYQHFMTYWDATMQDDMYLIAEGGWAAAGQLRLLLTSTDEKGKPKYTEEADFIFGTKASQKRYVADLLPRTLLIARFFSEEQRQLDEIEATASALKTELEELQEEHGNEGGYLFESRTDDDKFTLAQSKKYTKDRLAELSLFGSEDEEEKELISKCVTLILEIEKANKKAKAARKDFEQMVFDSYTKLTPEEAKNIVVHDKWLLTLRGGVEAELGRVSSALTSRVQELAERYAQPLSALEQKADELQNRVNHHLEKMGFVWA